MSNPSKTKRRSTRERLITELVELLPPDKIEIMTLLEGRKSLAKRVAEIRVAFGNEIFCEVTREALKRKYGK